MSRIFISYKRVDKDKVFKIKEQIESVLGEKCWIDQDGIESDAQFVSVIITAIDKADIVLFMYSIAHTYITDYDNDWTIRELNYAKEEGKRIVFICIDRTPLAKWFKFMFPQKQKIDALNTDSMNNLFNDLSTWLGIKNITKVKKEPVLTANENYQLARKYYYGGRGKPQDGQEAVKYYIKAAEQGSVIAQYELAVCLFNGKNGVLKDYEEAKKWFEKASTNGHSQAQCCLSDMFYYGICTPKDLVKACYWIVVSINNGNLHAQEKLDSFEKDSLHIMSADDMSSIGDLYFHGDKLISPDYSIAAKWYKRAVDKGHARAMFNLATCYYKGKGVKQNFIEAVRLFNLSIENGCYDAYFTLGKCYERGKGIQQNINKAIHFYQLASERGDLEANRELGYRYMKGDGIPQNYSMAIRCLTQITDKSSIISYDIGYCYENIDDDYQNIETAMKWYKVSAEMGEEQAIEAYNRLYQKLHTTTS